MLSARSVQSINVCLDILNSHFICFSMSAVYFLDVGLRFNDDYERYFLLALLISVIEPNNSVSYINN